MSEPNRIVGVDESGKGDFFGSLVIASFLADKKDESLLKKLGVRDGKLIANKKILVIDETLREDFAHAVVIIEPSKYNSMYKEIKNLNVLLAEGHAEAIETISADNEVDLAISDKFGKSELIENALRKRQCSVTLKQLVRGEAIIQVAAASILARAAFLREMDRLSDEVDFVLPRGAAPQVDSLGRELVEVKGVEVLEKVAKLHFKNYYRIVNPRLL